MNNTVKNKELDSALKAKRVVNRYFTHLQSITVLRQLIPLIIAAQKHRGVSLAYLEGDKSFEKEREILKDEIEKRFVTMKLFDSEIFQILKPEDFNRLQQEWKVMAEWTGQSLEDFQLHSYFIEQLMLLIFKITEQANYFLPSQNNISTSNAKASDDIILVQIILKDIPELIELIARLRGLATHAIVIKQCDDDHYLWIDQLIKELNQKKEKFRGLSALLQKYSMRHIPSLIDIQVHDVQIVQLSNHINQVILQAETIEFDNHRIFNMATKIIDSQNEVVNQGLEYIQGKIHRQFDIWHTLSN